MSARSWQRGLTLTGVGLALGAAALLPLAAVLRRAALAGAEGAGEVLSVRAGGLFAGSLALALAVTCLALVLGVPLGVVLGRARIPGRRLLLGLHALPVFLPPFLLALGWFHLLGRQAVLGGPWTSAWFFGWPGLVLVLVATLCPFVTLCTLLGVRGVEPALEDAGRLAAPPLTVAVRILVPLAWPAIAVGALLVFALAFAEVAVPMFLRVEVYPAAVFSRLGGLVFAPAEAAILALPVLVLALLLVAVERVLLRRHGVAALFVRGARRAPLALGRAGLPAFCLAIAGALLSVLPLGGLCLRAVGGAGFGDAWARLGEPLGNSLLVAGVAASVATVLAVPIGHGLARRARGAGWLDALALAAFLTPAAVSGVGLVAVWNHSATAWIYGSAAILVIGLLGRYLVVPIRVFSAGVIQQPVSQEEAAATSGAGYLRWLVSIVCPANWRALAGAWLLGAVFCLRDVETAILIYPPGGQTLPVRIFTLEANGPEASVAALALIHVGLTAAFLAAMVWVFRRRREVTA